MVKNMKVVIHGTKGGHHTFTDEKVEMVDARPDFNKVAAIGQQAYAINFNDGNVIFSKYRIIRDVIGDKRTGHVAFSVVIPNSKKLSGVDVKSLLDKLADDYCKQYIVNDNLDNVREDWQFIEKITNAFSEINNPAADDAENIRQGTEEAAYVYYSSDKELQKYFDNPYREEYSTYKQIFFVDKKYCSDWELQEYFGIPHNEKYNNKQEYRPENPLNALRHNPSNKLTGKMDLEPKYKLLFSEYANNIKIEVQENGFSRKNGDKISPKSQFKICYHKNHYEPKTIEGTLDEIRDNISIDDDKKTITIKGETKLKSKEYTFKFLAEDKNSNFISDAEIIVKKGLCKPEEVNNPFTVTYEELQRCKSCIVTAKKDDDLFSDPKDLLKEVFDNDVLNSTIDINLVLRRHKKINIIVKDKDGGQTIGEFIARKNTKEINVDGGFIEFIDDEINKQIKIIVECPNYNSLSKQFIPIEEDRVVFELEKKQKIEPKIAESSIGSVREESFISKHAIKILVVLGIAVIIVYTILYFLLRPYISSNTSNTDSIISNDSTNFLYVYLAGINLDSDTLNSFKKSHCEPKKAKFIEKILGSKKAASLPDYCLKIDTAIIMRNTIDSGDIDKLKQLTYSNQQKKFKQVIDSIKDAYKIKISDTLKNPKIRKMNLDDIADLINQMQNDSMLKEKEQQKPIGEVDKPKTPSNTPQPKAPEISPPKNSSNTEFWKLVNNGNVMKKKYDDLFKDGSKDYKDFYNKYLKTDKQFQKFTKIPERDRKSVDTFTRLEKLIEEQ
jgi:hypothetical protein